MRNITARTLEAGFESPLDYYYFLRYDDPRGREFDALVETLVVSETYFFREARQLGVLCDDVIVPSVKAGARAAHLVRSRRHRRGAAHARDAPSEARCPR